jgi:dTDP-4-amino-4,6-dideoxygalactose transaminase
VDKYTWVDVGSSYLPSEITAAFLSAQLDEADRLTAARVAVWERYHEAFASAEAAGQLRRPHIPDGCVHNAHLYYILMPTLAARDGMLRHLHERSINATFHYIPLHSAPAGRRFGRAVGDLPNTTSAAERLLRLPLWGGMSDADVECVIDAVLERALALAQP